MRLFTWTLIFVFSNQVCAQIGRKAANDFEKDIRPLLQKHCVDCHGKTEQNSGLRLDVKQLAFKGGDSGQVIVAGKSSESELFRRILSTDEDERMPPDESLSKSEIAILKKWIDSGAVWPESKIDQENLTDPRRNHWAFKPVSKVAVPEFPKFNNPIDRFVATRLREIGLSLSDRADKRTLIRRLSFVLTGLPPTPGEVSGFVNDSSSDAYEKVVKRLLSSPRYGERWAQHWLDVVRYADTHGFEVNTPRENAWHYRDYVIQAFNADMPYDRFVQEQLVGDAMNSDAATGFLVASAVLLPGQIGADDESKRLARQDELDEMVSATGASFLGLSIGCARCHDHKFDPITSRDYYSLQAFFAGVDFGDRAIQDASFQKRLAESKELAPRIRALEKQLVKFQPTVFPGETVTIDDADSGAVYLMKENGTGSNPKGDKRGYLSDPGDRNRLPNLSGGKYTWWDNIPGRDVMYYRPTLAGTYRLYLSWGVHGSGVHTRDARYLLDRDGDLKTKDDQTEIATIDQYYPANVKTGKTEMSPLWSGFHDAGLVELKKESVILLRGGKTGTGITADVIVLQSTSNPNVGSLPRFREPVTFKQNIEKFSPIKAKFVRFTSLATDSNSFREPCIDELEIFTAGEHSKNVALQSLGGVATSSGNYGNGTGIHQLKHINEGKYGNSHSWISNEPGRGWIQIQLADEYLIDRVVWARDRFGKFSDRLAIQYKIEVSLDQKNWTKVASHEDRVPFGVSNNREQFILRLAGSNNAKEINRIGGELEQLRSKKSKLEKPVMVYAGKFREPDKSFILRRGNPELKGAAVEPAVPAMFSSLATNVDTSNEQMRRKSLANWITSAENPLTARVMVNRIWMYHFGRGLVETPSDFGVNASTPTHPQLLDWLAGEFVRNRWSVKHLHELIVSSETWKQRSKVTRKAQKVDADNRYYWRFGSRRLEAEAIRDSMLAVSGELNLTMGGPGFDFFKTRGGLSGFPPVTEFKSEQFRRMIYAHKIRMERVPVFGAFDCPDAGQAMPSRSRSTTAIQALNLFNSPFVHDRASHFAERVIKETGEGEINDQIDLCFQIGLGRNPSKVEMDESSKVVEKHGLATLCRAIYNSNEFLFLP